MTDGNITKDTMYDAVAPDDFESMIELDRYEKRSTAFEPEVLKVYVHRAATAAGGTRRTSASRRPH